MNHSKNNQNSKRDGLTGHVFAWKGPWGGLGRVEEDDYQEKANVDGSVNTDKQKFKRKRLDVQNINRAHWVKKHLPISTQRTPNSAIAWDSINLVTE